MPYPTATTDSTQQPAVKLYEMHMHTPLCKHAEGDPGQYAAFAEKRGLAGIVVTCHNPMPNGYASGVRMDEEQFDTYLGLVDSARQRWAGRIDVRVGLECDFVPGYENYVERQIAGAPLHHVLGSVHPAFPEYKERYFNGEPLQDQKVYFEHLAQAAETGLFDTISHPDLIKNNFKSAWDEAAIMPDVLKALDRIAKAGTAMELNTSGLHKPVAQMNPFPAMLRAMKQRDIPIVVGSDAHDPPRVAGDWEIAYDLLDEAGYTHVSMFLDRRRMDVALAAAKATLRPVDE